jgi:hypothetical protein
MSQTLRADAQQAAVDARRGGGRRNPPSAPKAPTPARRPHQTSVARRLIERWPYRFLLCGAAGLGKAVDYSAAMRWLYLSGYLLSLFVATPAASDQSMATRDGRGIHSAVRAALLSNGVQHSWLSSPEQDTQSLYETPQWMPRQTEHVSAKASCKLWRARKHMLRSR